MLFDQVHLVVCACAISIALLVYAKLRPVVAARKSRGISPVSRRETKVGIQHAGRIDPCLKQVEELKPVPYRPFRWGDYHVTMGIRSIGFESWIEVDDQLAHFHRIRVHRVNLRGPKLVMALPPSDIVKVDGRAAAAELVEELAEFLSRRYPKIYSVERHAPGSGGLYNEGRIRTITMIPVNATYDLEEEDPMTVAGLLIQDDIALVLEGSRNDGVYYIRAGAIILPGFWRLEDKIGMSLDDIHFSGNVPQYQQKLRTSMNRFMQRLAPEKLIQRNNYHFAVVKDPASPGGPFDPLDPTEIGWAETMVGKEELFQAGTGLGAQDDSSPPSAPKTAGGHELFDVKPVNVTLRQERQTLRRLPKTGAIVFTVRTYVEPVTELVKEIGVPGRMASAIRSWPEDVAEYKSRDRFAAQILPYLDEHHQKQVGDGLLGADEKPQTDYPY
ncbi:hypothetical protein BDZ89DRAFT_1101300 [Hymenopellis radicata]|nr:hypothetical protein BDZ89DRAFT_1101300 [Hymenopellis radicata]